MHMRTLPRGPPASALILAATPTRIGLPYDASSSFLLPGCVSVKQILLACGAQDDTLARFAKSSPPVPLSLRERKSSPPVPLSLRERGNDRRVESPLSRRERGSKGGGPSARHARERRICLWK